MVNIRWFRYTKGDVDKLVEGALPQRRVLDLAPGINTFAGEEGKMYLEQIVLNSMEY
jgi:hydroxyacid-oxoacid transhydrogenase